MSILGVSFLGAGLGTGAVTSSHPSIALGDFCLNSVTLSFQACLEDQPPFSKNYTSLSCQIILKSCPPPMYADLVFYADAP